MFNQYQTFRTAGYRAAEALRAVKVVNAYAQLPEDQRAILAEPESESYFDVFGQPVGYTNIYGQIISAEDERKEIERQIEVNGDYRIAAYWRGELVDSVGHCVGYDDPLNPMENAYVLDLMQAVLDASQDEDATPKPMPPQLNDDMVDAMVARMFKPEIIASRDREDLREEAIGIAISQWTQWDGFALMRIAYHALNDSNYDRAANLLEQIAPDAFAHFVWSEELMPSAFVEMLAEFIKNNPFKLVADVQEGEGQERGRRNRG